MLSQYPHDIRALAQSNVLDLIPSDEPANFKKPRLSVFCELRRLLAHIADKCPEFLEGLTNSTPVFQTLQKLNRVVSEFFEDSTLTSTSTQSSSQFLTTIEGWIDSIEAQSLYLPKKDSRFRFAVLEQVTLIDQQNRPTCAFPSNLQLHHLCTHIMDALIPSNLLSADSDSALRVGVMSMLLKNMIFPACDDVDLRSDIFASATRTFSLFVSAKNPKAPPQVFVVFKPLLSNLCASKITMDLVDSLARLADVLPFFFNQILSAKVVEALRATITPGHQLASHPERHQLFLKLLQILCSLSRSIDCSAFISVVCESVTTVLTDSEETTKANALELLLRFLSNFQTSSFLGDLLSCHVHNQSLMKHLGVYAPYSPILKAFTLPEAPCAVTKMADFYRNEQLADVTIVCHSASMPIVRIPANRVILRLRCPMFEKMFTSGLAESSQTEIRLGDIDPAAFEIALKHIHGVPLGCDSNMNLDLIVRVLRLADFLALDELHREFEIKLCTVLKPCEISFLVDQLSINSTLWQQSSPLHLSPVAEKVRQMILEHLYDRSIINFDNSIIRDLLCFGLR